MPSPSDYQMIIHSKSGVIGHFTVELRGPDGKSIYRGFRPNGKKNTSKASGLQAVTGKVEDDDDRINDSTKPIKSSRPFSLSREQFDKAQEFVKKPGEAWTKYDLDERNCVDFVNETIKQAGVKGDVEDYLSAGQKDQMAGAAVYVRKKFGEDDPVETDNPIEGEIGGAPGTAEDVKQPHKPEVSRFLEDLKKPDDPVSDIMLKDPRDWTEGEVNQVHKSDFYQRASSPRRDEAFKKVKSWYGHHYSADPVTTDDTGKTVQPMFSHTPNDKPVPAKGKDGKSIVGDMLGVGSLIAEIAGKHGLSNAIRGVQAGINMLNKSSGKGETIQKNLKADGLFGPKSKQAFHQSISELGRPKVENAIALGTFKDMVDDKRAGSGSKLAETAHDSFSGLFQKPARFDDNDKGPKPWGLAIQDTINDVGQGLLGKDNFNPVKSDGWIGPKTATAFDRVFKPAGTGSFMKSLGSNFGFF